MPKSKRNRLVNMTQVSKKTREDKDKLFANIRETVPQYQHCFVFSVDNMRNNHLKDVRHELSDCRLFFGKTKLMSKALGQTRETALLDGTDRLTPHLSGTVGLLLTNRDPSAITTYFEGLSPVDFARAGTTAPREFAIPQGVLFATGGEVPREHDVPMEHSIEPELRRLGMPTRMVRGRIVLGEEEPAEDAAPGYVVCKEGDVLDSRQTRLLKLFGICMSEFHVELIAYWSAATGEVTDLKKATAMEE
ncbi:Ribosome assembly factor mrt4 like protein [Verticillium longisporum]|uniref:Ribosome assembly factor mrt4 n=1 Tax=Verticillium longisporum TaxID=100787 RepID=A0A8I3A0I5_VERLO|nr:Ribosome assembly factor mrt4 like protein [Verticillium longisporum]